MNGKSKVGFKGEELASRYLISKGYKILQRNFSKRYGEIDIVAIDNNTLVFIEVKTRTSDDFGNPLEAITPWKLQSLIKTAQYYKLTHRNLPDPLRIDAIGIKLTSDGEVEKIELIKNISGF